MGCSPSSDRYADMELRNPTTTTQHRTDSISAITDRPSTVHQILDFLKKEYSDDFEMFVVNNLLLSVQFFENFNEDIKVLHPNSEREREISKLNERLLRSHQKRIILPDTLHEKVNRNIRFRRPCGPHKGRLESFLPERLFIVDDNVEISHVDEDAYYSIDKNTFRATLIETDNVGFVKLREMDRRDTSTSGSKTSAESLDVYIDDPPASTSSAATTTTNDQPADIEGNYEELALIRSKERLVIAMDRNLYATIPKRCIVSVPLVTTEKVYDEKESNYVVKNRSVTTEYYISSKEMAKYFVHAEFPRRIGPLLNFSTDELHNAEKMLATIYLQSNRSGCAVNYEVTTVLDIQWPKFCTDQWYHRPPGRVRDNINHIIYEWPSEKQKDLMRKYKCVVIPRGFLQKYGVNESRSLEWEIAYPRVEKYLQTTMNLAQIKTYFLLMLLHKSFIEPVTKHQGIVADHIKTLMYWEIEQNFMQWPETRMGSKMRQILVRLEHSLSRRRQQHYFHHHKNVFGNIPDKYLYEAQTIVNKIVDNPVPYVLTALRNVRYTNVDSFYPMLDYEELYRQLRWDDIVATRVVPRVERKRTIAVGGVKPKVAKRDSVDTIDLQWFCKIGPYETIRRCNILVMFIKHFIEIGKQSSNRMITKQALLYLEHAMNLTVILEQEGPLQRAQVDTFTRQIETEQSRVKHATSDYSVDSMEIPALPPSRPSTMRT